MEKDRSLITIRLSGIIFLLISIIISGSIINYVKDLYSPPTNTLSWEPESTQFPYWLDPNTNILEHSNSNMKNTHIMMGYFINHNSSITWKLPILNILPYMNNRIKNITNSYILIKNPSPYSYINETSISKINIYLNKWDYYSSVGVLNSSLLSDIELLSYEGYFTGPSQFVFLTKKLEHPINADFLAIKWKINRNDTDFSVKILCNSEKWYVETGGIARQGTYTPNDWHITYINLKEIINDKKSPINELQIGIDWNKESAFYSLSVESMFFFNMTYQPNIIITLNNKEIFHETLDFIKGSTMLELDPKKYNQDIRFFYEYPYLKIPINNVSVFKPDSYITITISENTRWIIKSIVILFETDLNKTLPLWQEITYYCLLGTLAYISLLITLIYIIWIKI